MIRLAADNSPEEAAWAAFDAAALRLHAAYRCADPRREDSSGIRAERKELAIEAVHLWAEWRDLFLGGDAPRPAA